MVHSVYILDDNYKGKKCFSFVKFDNKEVKGCFYCCLKPQLGTLDNKNRYFFSSTRLNRVNTMTKWCSRTIFERYFGIAEKILKSLTIDGAL